MQKKEIMEILAEMLAMEADVVPEVDTDAYKVEVSVSDPMMDKKTTIYSYQVLEQEMIRIEKRESEQVSGTIVKNFRDIVWRCCRLERVCFFYRNEYENWKAENDGIPYIETLINDDVDGVSERGFAFIKNFWKGEISYDTRLYNFKNDILVAEPAVSRS